MRLRHTNRDADNRTNSDTRTNRDPTDCDTHDTCGPIRDACRDRHGPAPHHGGAGVGNRRAHSFDARTA